MGTEKIPTMLLEAQQAAKVFWTVATSEDYCISTFNSPIYRAAEKELLASIKRDYPGLTPRQVARVRQLVAEYGPDDRLTGTDGSGIESYVQYVTLNR